MLPFSRFSVYGNNITRPSTIKDIKVGYDTFILTDDRKLFGAGYNRYGELGLGHTNTVYDFTLLTEGVDEIVSLYNFCILIRKGNSYYYCGESQLFGNATVFTDCTSSTKYTTLGVGFVSVTMTSISAFGITADNDLYGRASNNTRGILGDGTTTASPAYKKLASNVSWVYTGTANNTFYVDLSGKLFGTGWNNAGQLGTANTTQVNTWTNLSALSGITNIKKLISDNSVSWILNGNDNRWYSAGNGITGVGVNRTTFGLVGGLVANANKFIASTSATTWDTFVLQYYDKSVITYCGYGDYVGIPGTSTTSQVLQTTPSPTNFNFNSNKILAAFGGEYMIWYDGTKLLGTGNSRFMPGKAGANAVVKFIELQLPPGVRIG